MFLVKCPKCKRVLGTTEKSVDIHLKCKGCKTDAHITLMIAKYADEYRAVDYLMPKQRKEKGENGNKSE